MRPTHRVITTKKTYLVECDEEWPTRDTPLKSSNGHVQINPDHVIAVEKITLRPGS